MTPYPPFPPPPHPPPLLMKTLAFYAFYLSGTNLNALVLLVNFLALILRFTSILLIPPHLKGHKCLISVTGCLKMYCYGHSCTILNLKC